MKVKLSVSDESGRIGSKTLLVEVTDQTPPEITFLNDEPLVRLIGTEFSLPPNIVAVSDNLDGDLTSGVQILDEKDLDPSKTTPSLLHSKWWIPQEILPLPSLKFCSKNRAFRSVVLQLMAT